MIIKALKMTAMFMAMFVFFAVFRLDQAFATENNIEDMEKIKQSYREYLAGNEEMNKSSLLTSKIHTVHNTANTRLNALLPLEERDNGEEVSLFRGVPLGESEANLKNSYAYLYQMALATQTYKNPELAGVNFYQNEEVVLKVIEGLDWLYTHFFEDQTQGYYGNWYQWEIGIPSDITKTFILLEDDIRKHQPELIEQYIQSMDLYLRNGKDGDIDLTSRFHTGANLADIATNRILQGALIDDSNRVSKAVSDILTVFETIDPNHIKNGVTDGFYEDGSFIQHHSVAYTGAYGKVLLNRVAQTMRILDGTQYIPEDILVPTVKEWIYKGFSPVIFEGYMMEIVKGRAVSRTGTGYSDVVEIVEYMVDLSNYLSEEDNAELKSHIKYIVTQSPTSFSPSSFTAYDNILHFHELMNDDRIEAVNRLGGRNHFAFNSMDKTVHLRDSYAFALSRSSNRISKYEYMSGENLMPWFQGDGAFYLYLSGRDQTESFGVNYFATINPYQLPGTTVPVELRQTIPELYDGKLFYDNPNHPLHFTSSSESQNKYVYFPLGTNTFSGGVTLDGYGVAGIQLGDEIGYLDKQKGLLPDDFVVYKNSDANKSTFMFDDEIVMLGSGIKDELGRKVMTTVDNRMYGLSEISTITGETYHQEKLLNPDNGEYPLKWINFTTNQPGTQVGYYFPTVSSIHVSQETVTENIQKIRQRNPDREVTENFFTLGIDHGENPQDASYAYVLLPNFTEAETKVYAENPAIQILANTSIVHAVEHTELGIKGFNFFGDKKTTVSNVTSYNPASILVKEDGNVVTVAVSDPTFSVKKMKLKISLPNPEVLEVSEGVKASVSRHQAVIHVDTEKANGESFVMQFKIHP